MELMKLLEFIIMFAICIAIYILSLIVESDKTKLNEVEHFRNFRNYTNRYRYRNINNYYPSYYDIWQLSRYGLLPWNNSTRFTRNMSYDLRGDVYLPPYYTGPWNNSTYY